MPSENAGTLRLLIVDDVAENRTLLSRRFSRQGYICIEAESGAEALQQIESQTIDLVLLDVMMPVMDGMEVLEIIRTSHSADELPVIMVTGRAQGADVAEALKLGANDYVTKPVDFLVVSARVRVQLARKRAAEALQHSHAQLAIANQLLEDQIAERERADMQLLFARNHDPITGLGNRTLLREKLNWPLHRTADATEQVALFCIGVDGFRTVAATYGQSVCDQLAQDVAGRLETIVGQRESLARLNQSDFAIIEPALKSTKDASRLAERLLAAIAAPFKYNGIEISLNVNAGIALASIERNDADSLMKCAYLALQGARAEGRNKWRFFESAMNTQAQERQAFEADLRKAVTAGDFRLHYQPILNIASKAIEGYEALIRWKHPEYGEISPAIFIPIAEETGLMGPLGDWVLRHACQEASTFASGLKVSVNISAVQFDSDNLVQKVLTALASSGLAPHRLELEITETALLGDRQAALKTLQQLRSLGVRISLDDFGTGYSSLNYLRDFPFDRIKIDQSFVRVQTGQSETRAIVRAITGLAKDLGMATTAEGVETQEQFDWLIAEGCTDVQGYLIGRPAPACDFVALQPIASETASAPASAHASDGETQGMRRAG